MLLQSLPAALAHSAQSSVNRIGTTLPEPLIHHKKRSAFGELAKTDQMGGYPDEMLAYGVMALPKLCLDYDMQGIILKPYPTRTFL